MNQEKSNPSSDKKEVKAQPAVLRATIQVTRKATGKVETYQIVGTPVKGS